MNKNNSNTDDKKNQLVVYTALFGDYDDLVDPPEKFEGCDFICFTNQKNLKSRIWQIKHIEECDLPLNMMNRKYKILPHLFFPEYERSLYIDTNISILQNPKELSDIYLSQFIFVVPKHFARDCIYDEAFTLIRSGRVGIIKLFYQTSNYLKNGYTCQTKMGENNILLRRHHDLIVFSQEWWGHYTSGVSRDQLSLAFISWKKGVEVKTENRLSAREGNYFTLRKHKYTKRSSILGKIIRLILFGYPYYFYIKIKLLMM